MTAAVQGFRSEDHYINPYNYPNYYGYTYHENQIIDNETLATGYQNILPHDDDLGLRRRHNQSPEAYNVLSRNASVKSDKGHYRVRRKKSVNSPGYYRVPQKSKKKKVRKVDVNFKTKEDLEAVFDLLAGDNLPLVPSEVLQYSVHPPYQVMKRNPTLKFKVVTMESIENNKKLAFTDSNTSYKDYTHVKQRSDDRTLISWPEGESRESSKASERLGLMGMSEAVKDTRAGHNFVRSNPADDSIKRSSTVAELSLESNSEVYNELKNSLFHHEFNSWPALERYIRAERPDIWDNEYVLTRLMMEVYLRRVISGRTSLALGTGRGRLSAQDIQIASWRELRKVVSSVYGHEQLSFFREQTYNEVY